MIRKLLAAVASLFASRPVAVKQPERRRTRIERWIYMNMSNSDMDMQEIALWQLLLRSFADLMEKPQLAEDWKVVPVYRRHAHQQEDPEAYTLEFKKELEYCHAHTDLRTLVENYMAVGVKGQVWMTDHQGLLAAALAASADKREALDQFRKAARGDQAVLTELEGQVTLHLAAHRRAERLVLPCQNCGRCAVCLGQ